MGKRHLEDCRLCASTSIIIKMDKVILSVHFEVLHAGCECRVKVEIKPLG